MYLTYSKFFFVLSAITLLLAVTGCLGETKDSDDNTTIINIPVSSDIGRQDISRELFDIQKCDQNLIVCIQSNEEWYEALSLEPDVIVFLPGRYELKLSEITFPVEVYSATLWEAEINAGSYIKISSPNVRLSGLKFNHGGSPSGGRFEVERYGALLLNAENIQVDNNYFDSIGVGSTVKDRTGIAIHIVDSDKIEIKNNVFIASQAIAIKTSDSSKNVLVLNNDFLDSFNFGGAGEVFHIGDALSSSQGVASNDDSSFSTFKNNYVSNWNLEKELISIKSNDNVIESNLVIDSGDSAVVVRMGNSNSIRNNIIIGNKDFPFRISGEQNIFEDNIACGEGVAVSLHNEMLYREQSINLHNSYWAANNNTFLNNTFSGYFKIGIIDDGYASDADYYNSSPFGNYFYNNTFYFEGEFDYELVGVTNESNRIEDVSSTCELELH